jgi:dolichol-phosphate mannosyltransferase
MSEKRAGVVVIPTYNELENIERLVDAIHALQLSLDIAVVDDNSPDGTGELADRLRADGRLAHVIHRPGKLGLGSAYVAGFRWALTQNYPLVLEMDADFSHDPESLPVFLEEIKRADVVLGSRYINGITVVNWPIGRLLLSYTANAYARFVTRMPLRDATGGFKCFRREVLERIDLSRISSEGYSFQIEMNFLAFHHGFRVVETPILFRDRLRGTSKMNFRINREAAWMVWRLRLLALTGRLKRG